MATCNEKYEIYCYISWVILSENYSYFEMDYTWPHFYHKYTLQHFISYRSFKGIGLTIFKQVQNICRFCKPFMHLEISAIKKLPMRLENCSAFTDLLLGKATVRLSYVSLTKIPIRNHHNLLATFIFAVISLCKH